MVKHCYSVANSSGQSLGTHGYQRCYGSGCNSQACSFGQATVVSVALGQGLKTGGLALTVLHLPLALCDSRHTQLSWPPPSGTLPSLPTHPSLRKGSTFYAEPPSTISCTAEATHSVLLTAANSCQSGKKRFGVRCSCTQIRARSPTKL